MADEFRFLTPSDDVTNRDRSSIEFDVTDDGLGLLAHALNPDDDLVLAFPIEQSLDLLAQRLAEAVDHDDDDEVITYNEAPFFRFTADGGVAYFIGDLAEDDLPYNEVMNLIHDDLVAATVTEPEYDIFDFFTDSELAELDAACFGMNLADEMHLDRLVTEYMDQIDDIFAKVEKRINIQKTDQWNWSDSARDSDAQEVL